MCIWRCIASVLAALLLAWPAAQAEDKPPEKPATLDLSPASIAGRTVSDDEPVYFLVRLKAGSQELSDITLSTFSNDGVTATPEAETPASVAALPANAEQTWKIKVTPAKRGVFSPAALNVQVAVGYREGKDKPLQRYQFQTLAITAPGAVTVTPLADIEFKGSLEALSYQRPGRLFVTITNKSSEALDVIDIKVSTSSYITATPEKTQLKLPYGSAEAVPVSIAVGDQIVPGKYPIVVVATLRTPAGLPGSVVKAQDVDIAVLGEADILSKIGAPSLLFLPGVLFLLTWQLLWSIGRKDDERGKYSLTITTGGFWVVAVALALVVARLYPWVAGYAYPWIAPGATAKRRDYLEAYGFYDYALLFALSIAAATVLYLAWLALQKLQALHGAWVVRRNTPAATDQPVDIIHKLGRLGQTVALPRAHPSAGNAGDIVYILDSWRNPPSIWIIPPALLADGPQADANSRNLADDIQVGRIIEAARLHRLLVIGIEAQWWTLQWQAVAGINAPRSVAASSWTELPIPGDFIRGP
jgi:hypothetical protein